MTDSSGHTPDISKFRFHIWEPIWYFVSGVKVPLNNLRLDRKLEFADSSGHDMTYYIWTEDDPRRNKKGHKQYRHRVLIRYVIRTRRKDIGKDDENINNDPSYSSFFLTPSEISRNNIEGVDDCAPSLPSVIDNAP